MALEHKGHHLTINSPNLLEYIFFEVNYEKLVLYQDNIPELMIIEILITRMLNHVLMR